MSKFCILLVSIFGVFVLQVLAEPVERTSFILSEPHELVDNDATFRTCKPHGMVPVSITSGEKNLEVIRFLASKDIGSVWTSGDDLLARGDYEWTLENGKRIDFEYEYWLAGAPKENETCRCVSFVSGVHSSCGEQPQCAGWTVEPCSSKRRVLCELPIPSCK